MFILFFFHRILEYLYHFTNNSLITFLILLFSNDMNYFIITDNYLIVKTLSVFGIKIFWEIESINIHRHFRQFGKTSSNQNKTI